ncbi:hypothetical protein CDAR_421891 [Caerostris darwini]|uniref:Uncharacterized protein n=1 Tax=Caerostris darwini TaxID=1538125 RepID=A0AAV4VD21_9ARAC|nr:hypothetical protein CDAR_421891 [Caerostris darwini]
MNAVRIQYGKDKRFITGEDTSSGGCPPVGEQLRLLTTGFVRSVSLETPSALQHLIGEKYLQNYPYTRSLIKPLQCSFAFHCQSEKIHYVIIPLSNDAAPSVGQREKLRDERQARQQVVDRIRLDLDPDS